MICKKRPKLNLSLTLCVVILNACALNICLRSVQINRIKKKNKEKKTLFSFESCI